MSIRLFNSAGGYIDLESGGNGSTANVFTLPAETGTIVINSASQTLTNKTLGSGLVMGASAITSGTAQASTSGTSIDFTGIPSWVKRITVMFNGVSTNGTARVMVQLGDSGGVETTGYAVGSYFLQTSASNGFINNTSGFVIYWDEAAGLRYGVMQINLVDASTNLWSHFGNYYADSATDDGLVVSAGNKALSATLDRIRITTSNGTDTFDAGTINILYE